jgi:hypothetical protein
VSLSIFQLILVFFELNCPFPDYSYSERYFEIIYDVHFSVIREAQGENSPCILRLTTKRHKNRLTIYCYKSRFQKIPKYLESLVNPGPVQVQAHTEVVGQAHIKVIDLPAIATSSICPDTAKA